MDRHSRSPDQMDCRRYYDRRNKKRSRSPQSRSRSPRPRDRRRKYDRSMSRERMYRRGGGNNGSPDSYGDNMDQRYNNNRRDRRHYHRNRASSESSNDDYANEHINYKNQTPSNKIIVLGLAKHLTEADINSDLHMCGIQPLSIRLIRKRKTGQSRGFAFVEFQNMEDASNWIEIKQGVLMIQDQYRAIMQYSVSKESTGRDRIVTDWYCAKCGVFNFKRRDNCFKCNASREESENGGSDEVSNILTKKIMLRNLDALTNEEGVLTSMQDVIPTLVSKISKILICRDPLTSTSRGICYLMFDNLVDSMNTHNALKSLEPPLVIDNREVIITYCVDSENRQMGSRQNNIHSSHHGAVQKQSNQYTLADVPGLAEYSASVYAKTPAEHDYYYNYYTDYYTEQINNGQFSSIPNINQIGETANSGAAVALSAIQRKQQKQLNAMKTAAPTPITAPIQIPNGQDNKKYPTPDISQYVYDETSSYYYDPKTGLYYDPNSQYYYNGEIASYLYWDQDKSTYVLAQSTETTSTAASNNEKKTDTSSALAQNVSDNNKEDEKKPDAKQDKVKVAKKIVKDMERWAKQLNQKKENAFQAVQSVSSADEAVQPITIPKPSQMPLSRSGYADVGFAILENRDTRTMKNNTVDSTQSNALNKILPYASDSDDPADHFASNSSALSDKDLIDFDKLACLLCKRAFQSLDILNKHIKMSNLHKENLQKLSLNNQNGNGSNAAALEYRDRAKERRLKYGEADPPPPNRSRERFEKEMRKQTAQMQKQASNNLASTPIDGSNLGNRLLQRMGWTEGQGLGKTNQGRTKIIEAESRAPSAGLGSKTSGFVPGDDYRTYIKRMMKSRYDQSD